MVGRVRLLAWQLEHARDRLDRRLAGLTEEEFLWEPVPGCWTIRPRPGGHGTWLLDYEDTGGPAPFTTIAWRLVHLTHITAMCREYTFGAARARFDDVRVPGTVADAVRWWGDEVAAFAAALDDTEDDHLDDTVRPVWMEPTSVLHMVHIVIEEHIHHGAEIGCLRDLHRVWV